MPGFHKFALAFWLLLFSQLACNAAAEAAGPRKGTIDSIEPASLRQGDTTLLTIKGSNLPVGSVVVEFYPQQIAVVSVLSSDERELTVQIKVPQIAPPGSYSVMIYNQLGDEAFASALLSIGSNVSAPLFRSYDPKVIAEASSAFAVVLTGDSISPEAVSHLHMLWTLDGAAVSGLESVFSYSGPSTAVCSVSGSIPSGKLRGKVLFDENPVYMLDLQVSGSGPGIVGHSPAVCVLVPGGVTIRLLGTGLKEAILPRLSVRLSREKEEPIAGELAVTDEATLTARFISVSSPGEYQISLISDGVSIYEGRVQLEQPAPEPPAETPAMTPEVPAVVPADVPANTAPAAQPASDVPAELPAVRHLELSITPTQIPAGAEPARFSVRGLAGENLLPEQVNIAVFFEGNQCERVFGSSRGDSMVFVFAPPPGGWLAGKDGSITIQGLPEGEFTQTFSVNGLPGQSGVISTQTASSAAKATADSNEPAPSVQDAGMPALLSSEGFSLTLKVSGRSLPAAEWSRVQLDSSDVLLKANAARFEVLALSRPLGDSDGIELQFRRKDSDLDELTWAALSAALDAEPVTELILNWPELGLSCTIQAHFAEAPSDSLPGTMDSTEGEGK